MYTITVSGALADDLGNIELERMVHAAADYTHAQVMLIVEGESKLHATQTMLALPPAPRLVRLIKIGPDKWMVQGRYGKLSDGEPYNAAGASQTFTSQELAKTWLENEPAGRWRVTL